MVTVHEKKKIVAAIVNVIVAFSKLIPSRDPNQHSFSSKLVNDPNKNKTLDKSCSITITIITPQGTSYYMANQQRLPTSNTGY